MSVKITYPKTVSKKLSTNIVLFTNENFKINSLKKYLSNSEFSYINDLLKTSDLKKKYICLRVKFKKENYFNFY